MAQHVSIFLENKTGHFERVTRILRLNGINIRSIALTHTTNDWGVLNLLVDQPDQAYSVLTEAGLSVALRKVFVFEMEDKPGGLDEVLLKIGQAGVNIINAYGQLLQKGRRALLIVDVGDYEAALPLLESRGLIPLPDNHVYEN